MRGLATGARPRLYRAIMTPPEFFPPRARIAVLTAETVGVLDYLAPDEGVRQGQLVLVPLGPRRVLGLVWGPGKGDFDLAKLRAVARVPGARAAMGLSHAAAMHSARRALGAKAVPTADPA